MLEGQTSTQHKTGDKSQISNYRTDSNKRKSM